MIIIIFFVNIPILFVVDAACFLGAYFIAFLSEKYKLESKKTMKK